MLEDSRLWWPLQMEQCGEVSEMGYLFSGMLVAIV
jgi:hypothetical protein